MKTRARAVSEARTGLRQAAADLQEIVHRLSRIREALPVAPEETSQEDLGPEEDVLTQLRAVINCVSRDRLAPALRDLLTAAAFRSVSPPAEGEPAEAGSLPKQK